MSDEFYRQRANRRNIIIITTITAIVLVYISIRFVRDAYFDRCTESFTRSPESVVSSYINAIKHSDTLVFQRCWDRDAYYELDKGCSEICLSRIIGTAYENIEISVESAWIIENNRSNISANVSISCSNSGDFQSGEILLDSISANLPWKHWRIIYSTFGGSIGDLWCNE